MKEKVYLYGPFVGELFWELIYFAPFAIFKKHQDPTVKTIVFTRPTRFDLYGRWADILVPLKIKEEEKYYKQVGFGLEPLSYDFYKELSVYLKKRYSSTYIIKDHFYPDIVGFRSKVKWQFLRDNMLYDFKPRKENSLEVRKIIPLNKKVVFVDVNTTEEFTKIYHELKLSNYYCISNNELVAFLKETQIKGISYVGYIIELIRNCKFVVTNFSSLSFRVSLLLKIPLLCPNEAISDDTIHLLNPFNTKVIKCSNIKDGIQEYENSI
jgi:hypothetical protein